MLALLLLTGCAAQSILPTVPVASVSEVPTSTPTSKPPMATNVISLTQASVPTTPTPISTLTAEQIRAFVVSALQDPRRCELPCWWNIVPGETTWETARNSFIQQGLGWIENAGQDGMTFRISYPDHPNPFTYRVDVNLLAKNGSVQSMSIKGEGGLISNHFAQDWRLYSLKEILMQYGQPSHVLLAIALPHESGANSFYTLSVFYQQQGFGIAYGGIADESGSKVHVCPALEQVSDIRLWLQSPTSKTSIDRLAISPDERPYFRSLEEATGLNTSMFYEAFKDTDQQQCVDTPASMWP